MSQLRAHSMQTATHRAVEIAQQHLSVHGVLGAAQAVARGTRGRGGGWRASSARLPPSRCRRHAAHLTIETFSGCCCSCVLLLLASASVGGAAAWQRCLGTPCTARLPAKPCACAGRGAVTPTRMTGRGGGKGARNGCRAIQRVAVGWQASVLRSPSLRDAVARCRQDKQRVGGEAGWRRSEPPPRCATHAAPRSVGHTHSQ